ncbi:MAG: hypothetical protein AAGI52_15670 [Bacteroidota bacterium]
MPARLLRLGLLLGLLAPAAAAQGGFQASPRATDLVDWTARIVPGDTPGEARYVLDVTVAEGWNLYGARSEAGIPLRVTLGPLPRGVVTRGGLRETATENGMDEALGLPYAYHTGRARISQGLRVDRRASGRHRIRASVRYTVCNDSVCLPPTTTDLAATLSVGGGS